MAIIEEKVLSLDDAISFRVFYVRKMAQIFWKSNDCEANC